MNVKDHGCAEDITAREIWRKIAPHPNLPAARFARRGLRPRPAL